MSATRTIWLVAKRELRERVASRAFQISTGVTILIVLGLLLAPTIFGLDDPPEYTIGTTGEGPDIAAFVVAATPTEGTTADVEPYAGSDELRDAVLEARVDIGVENGATVLTGPGTPPELISLVSAAIGADRLQRQADALGLDPEDVAALLGAAGPEVVDVEPSGDTEERGLIAFIGTLLLFVSIVTYGQWILIGVVEEKTSRVVEVVLGAIRPRYLLAGKVVGIGLLGLAQLVVIAVLGVYVIRTTDAFDLPEVGVGLVVIVVGWFLLGFAFFASGFAVAGSLVSRQEEAQNASFPLTMVMLVGYFTATSALTGGDNVVLRVLSIVPPFSPMTMPLRQATGDALPWEVAVSVALMVVAITVMIRIGGRVYSGGLLKTGGKVKLREALQAANQ